MSILAIRSRKGGVGRTTLTALLAQALAARGRNVTVLDLDPQDSLRLHFGLVDAADAFSSDARLAIARAGERVRRVATSPADFSLRLGAGARTAQTGEQVLSPWVRSREVLIIDTAAGDELSDRALENVPHLDLVVALADAASIATMRDLAEAGPLANTFYVINQFDPRRPLGESAQAFLRHAAGEAFIGAIRRDEAVAESFGHLTPLRDFAPASAAWADVERIARRLEDRLELQAFAGGTVADEDRAATLGVRRA